jgi:hypothetical protein
MGEQSLPIDSHRSWLLVDLVPDDWNRGARDHPYHETIGPVPVATSETYTAKASCVNGIMAVKALAADAVIEDQTRKE